MLIIVVAALYFTGTVNSTPRSFINVSNVIEQSIQSVCDVKNTTEIKKVKNCHCSSECTCGCNEGKPCRCLSHSQPFPENNVITIPVQQPIRQFQSFPMRSGSSRSC